jgi:predicted phosphodiesterase
VLAIGIYDIAVRASLGSNPPQVGAMRQDWGSGKAKLVKRASSGPEEVVVFLSDLHVPFHSPEAVASALKMIRDLKPHRVVLNGDLSDFHSLSRFNTSMSRLDALQDDIDQTNAIRIKVRQAAPDATVDETEGNHDNRVKTYVAQNARSLASLRALEPGSLFRYKELEINWHPGAGFRLRRDFLVRHGSVTRGEAGASAKAEFNQYGISGISGHTHRLATYRKAGYVPGSGPSRAVSAESTRTTSRAESRTGRRDARSGCSATRPATSSFTRFHSSTASCTLEARSFDRQLNRYRHPLRPRYVVDVPYSGRNSGLPLPSVHDLEPERTSQRLLVAVARVD